MLSLPPSETQQRMECDRQLEGVTQVIVTLPRMTFFLWTTHREKKKIIEEKKYIYKRYNTKKNIHGKIHTQRRNDGKY